MKASNKKGELRAPRVNPVHCPKDVSLEEWQRALRKQAAEKEHFGISRPEESGDIFEIRSAKTDRLYHVEYFGKDSSFNRCECMDFKTNRLGTCKHIEVLGLPRNVEITRIIHDRPVHSSVIVDYRNGRKIRLRIGTIEPKEMARIAAGLFAEDGYLKDIDCNPSDFIRRAKEIDPDFRWETEAFDLLFESRDSNRRKEIICRKYAGSDFTGLLKTRLHPYQVEGVKFAFAGGRTINADEMGLGKTVQAIATAELMKREGLVSSVLIICPTSLKYQWLSEIRRFTASSALVVEGNIVKRIEQLADSRYFYKICSFHAISNNIKAAHIPVADMIIYDELQRLKNWDTQMGRQLRKLSSQYVLALSGTPLENKLNDLYSVTQFVDQFVLGPLYRFTADTTNLDDLGRVVGYHNLHKVAETMSSTLIRRKKADVKIQMPSRTDKNLFVPMTKEQQGIHDEYKSQVASLIAKWKRFRFLSETDRKRLLLLLAMMRMVCDSTFIIDQKSRHDTKIDEIKEIIHSLVESDGGKVVIFSQWERMLRILAKELEAERIDFCFLHGGVPSVKRKDLIDRFREDPGCRVFLSTDAGATGLNLQSASTVINIDLPWNPAVLEQRIARVYRLGQENPVQVINMVARNTIEERMLSTLNFKSNLAAGILDGGEDAVFLDNNKFDRIMDIVGDVVENKPQPATDAGETTPPETQDSPAPAQPKPEPAPQAPKLASSTPATPVPKPTPKPGTDTSSAAPAQRQMPTTKDEMRDFVAGGMNFLGTLAKVLREPDGAKAIADALVKEDPDTGKATLNIPVPDKSTVTTLLSALSTLLNR